MYIPHWLVLTLAWIVIAVAGVAALTALGFLVVWCLNKLHEQARFLLGFLGYWAAFSNYLQMMLVLPHGGRLYAYQYLKPKLPFQAFREEQRERQLRLENTPEDWAIFDVVPHPEAYRWWMRCFGVRKPDTQATA